MEHGSDDVLPAADDAGPLYQPGDIIAGKYRLGRVLGTSGKTYVSMRRESEPVPLGAMYLLARGRKAGGPIEPAAVDPRELLASSFV